jgi:hypothetical protein
MKPHIADVNATSTGLDVTILGAIRRLVATWPRRWLIAITLLSGALAAIVMAATAHRADLTFAGLSQPAQSLMSIPAPLLGILLAGDLRRTPRGARVMPSLLAATLLAAAIGVFGVLVCAAALALALPGAAQDPWGHVVTIAVGSVLVQVVAQLVGVGLGLLLRPAWLAFAASIVLPLGLWYVLGAVEVLRPAQAWLTPYGTVGNLLSGTMDPGRWAQWLAVFLIWGVGLNAVGAARLNRST